MLFGREKTYLWDADEETDWQYVFVMYKYWFEFIIFFLTYL